MLAPVALVLFSVMATTSGGGPAAPNVRAKPRVSATAETAHGPGTGGVVGEFLRAVASHPLPTKSTTYDIGSWRAGGSGVAAGPRGARIPSAHRGPGAMPLALRLSEGLGSTFLICATLAHAETGTAPLKATRVCRWLMSHGLASVFEPPRVCSEGAPSHDRRRYDKLTISGCSLPRVTAATRTALAMLD